MTGARPRQEVERDVMGALHRELSRLNLEERARALKWVQERLAADALVTQSIRQAVGTTRTREDGEL